MFTNGGYMFRSSKRGQIEVICGCMFSGKTEELLRRVKRVQIANQKFQLIRSERDTRGSLENLCVHYGISQPVLAVSDSQKLRELIAPDVEVVAIDGAHFFDKGIVDVCGELADGGVRVIIAGLDLNFRGEPFEVMSILMAKAERLDKLSAICMVCGKEATRTQRLVKGEPAPYDDPILLVGGSEMYEARCRSCHQVPKP